MDVMALGVQIRSTGGQRVIRELQDVDRVGRGTARSLGGMSRVLQDVARDFAVTGGVGTRELKQLARGATETALLFGAGGPIIAGVGLVALAFITHFSRARQEMEETRKKAVVELARMQDAGDVAGILKQARELEFGRPSAGVSAGAPGAFKGSIRDLKAELATLNLDIVSQQGEKSTRELQRMTDRANELRAQIRSLEGEVSNLMTAAINIGEAPQQGMRAIEVTADATSVGVERLQGEIDVLARKLTSLDDIKPRLADTFNFAEELIRIRDRPVRIPAILDFKFPGEIPPDVAANMERQAEALAGLIGTGITDTLAAIFTGDDILAGFGSMLVRFGEIIIQFSGFMEVLKNALLTNPLFAGAIGFMVGAAMIALGASLRGAAGGGGARGGGGFGRGVGRQENVSRFVLGQQGTGQSSGMASEASNLRPLPPMHFTFIGENDGKAQRWLVNTLSNAGLRGLKVRG